MQRRTDLCGFPIPTLPYSRCCPLLYPSQSAGSISSCLQLTLTEVTHFVDPRSGSLVTLGHSALSSNTRDVIWNGISDSRIDATEGLCNKLENSLYQTIFLHFLTNFFFGMYTLIQTLNSKTSNSTQKV